MNNVFINDKGYLEARYIGDQTYDTVSTAFSEQAQQIALLQQQNKKVLILADISAVGKTDTGARRSALESLKKLSFDKMALVGGTVFIRTLAQMVVKVAGKENIIKQFSTLQEAEKWFSE